ncbi:MAG: glycine--tRNA ligase subunit beta, partial [Alphaproteobacteria bacterium]|nr:glycine--tRNA ligase subunit beta [Alphaproteobacteria bacterium]
DACLTAAMKVHQKCFSLTPARGKKLSNHFLAVSNLQPKDRGKAIVAGNEKVINARLADAKFFWEQDLKKPLDEMASALSAVTYHDKLGTQQDRVERISELAFQLAGACDADPEDARRAAQLCKADLVSGMVGEFPELQGVMGRTYAEHAGAKPEIARAIELHYKPKGPSDTVPREDEGDAVACAVALADKLDMLVGFWTIGEKPTGSGDPYQLRRAGLGIIRILLENDFRLRLGLVASKHFQRIQASSSSGERRSERSREYAEAGGIAAAGEVSVVTSHPFYVDGAKIDDRARDLLSFLAERLKVHLRETGVRHDLIDAVFALEGQDDLALIVKRVIALGSLLETDDGSNLLAGVKRASNILSIEEKKDGMTYSGAVDVGLLQEPAEVALEKHLGKVVADIKGAIEVENFTGAMSALAELRAPIDAFFEIVTVNVDDAKVRENRLKILARIRNATSSIADFSKIAGA